MEAIFDAIYVVGQVCSLALLVYGGYVFFRHSADASFDRIVARLALYDSLGDRYTVADAREQALH